MFHILELLTFSTRQKKLLNIRELCNMKYEIASFTAILDNFDRMHNNIM